ncbi:hypothetical protein GCM10010431_16250 [Streptomyces kunmingensis]
MGARLDDRDGSAVHLLQDALPGQRVEVAADRHVGHAELPGQFVDPDAAAAADLVEDEGAALLCEEVLILAHVPSDPFTRYRLPPGLLCCVILARATDSRTTARACGLHIGATTIGEIP